MLLRKKEQQHDWKEESCLSGEDVPLPMKRHRRQCSFSRLTISSTDVASLHGPNYRRIPTTQRIRSTVNGTPSNQRMNAFPMTASLSPHSPNDVARVLACGAPTPSEDWPGLRHALPLAQGSIPIVYAWRDRLCRHRRPVHDSYRSRYVPRSNLP